MCINNDPDNNYAIYKRICFSIIFSAMLLNGPFFVTFQTLACATGIVAFAFYAKKGCDPLRAKYISNANQVTIHIHCNQLVHVICLYQYGISNKS